MDLDKITIFAAMKKRLAWFAQRQEVLAQNIANADTPKYRPRDLKPFDFVELVRRENSQINMTVTRARHLGGIRKRIRDFAETKERRPYETAPSGNAVILEEQMMKVGETSMKHKLITELYKKHLTLLRMAVSSK